MSRRFLVTVLFAAGAVAAATADEVSTVFRAGGEGYASIRIPAVLATRAGTVLAFAEGRVVAHDQAENDIVLKRSADGGRTWSPLQVVAERGKDSLNNPCVVEDAKSGRLILMFQVYPAHIREAGRIEAGCEGTNTILSLVTASEDDGKTWSPAKDVTKQVKHPAGATTLAGGPGIGLQLRHGPHAGRLVMPFNEGPFGRWQVYAAFSDDGGATWTAGGNAPGALVADAKGRAGSRVNEVQMVELDDGSILLNSRNPAGPRNRTAAVSRDGGRTWSEVRIVPELFDAPCMASVLRVEPGGRGRLLFSGPTKGGRRDGALSSSEDNGATWRRCAAIRDGPFAYSCLVSLPDGRVGCLYETGEQGCYERIDFGRLPMPGVPAGESRP